MPTYTLQNKKTKKSKEVVMTYNELEQYLIENPNYQYIPGLISIGDSVRLGVKKTDQGFRDVLKQIKKNNPKSNIQV